MSWCLQISYSNFFWLFLSFMWSIFVSFVRISFVLTSMGLLLGCFPGCVVTWNNCGAACICPSISPFLILIVSSVAFSIGTLHLLFRKVIRMLICCSFELVISSAYSAFSSILSSGAISTLVGCDPGPILCLLVISVLFAYRHRHYR